MKFITLIIGLLVVGCGKQEQTTTEKPVKELTLREKVVGEYKMKDDSTVKVVFPENGVAEYYKNDKQWHGLVHRKWSIVNGEIHLRAEGFVGADGSSTIIKINKDGSLTLIASIDKDGKREDIPKEDQWTCKKIK